ncbi:MAG: 30S ribosomal protein S15 [Candidatus Nanohaloarchaea archaeon]
MHSDGRGSSGSEKPLDESQPDWVDYDKEEVVDLVLKLRDEGLQPAQIGLRLRDQYGIPDVEQITENSVTEILEENDASLKVPEDLQNLIEKAEKIQEHIEDNPEDAQAQRRLELTEAKIRRIASYHRENGNIDEDWNYSR